MTINSKREYLDLIVLLILIIVATIISHSFSVDSKNYKEAIEVYNETSWRFFFQQLREFELFHLIVAKLLPLDTPIIYFSIIATLSLTLKLYLFKKTSRSFELSLLFYLAYFFVLLDGTQVRVSIAISIAFWGIFFLSKNRSIIAAALIAAAALFFHYSIFFLFIVFFIRKKEITKYIIFSWFILMAVWLLGVNYLAFFKMLLSYIDPDFFGVSKIKIYLQRIDPNSAPYSLQFLLLFFSSICVYNRYKNVLNDFEVICFNLVFFSFIILVIFTGESVLQNRLSEIYRFGIVFIFPLYYKFILDITHRDWLTKAIIATLLIGYFFYYVVLAGLIVIPNQ
ncbi:MAG: EpsG family protein [Oceanospirillaceae bacterium]|nr:EpsG family protein [Oceanospirillaceae bacterium]